MNEPFVDKMNLTFPPECQADAADALQSIFDLSGATADGQGSYRFPGQGSAQIKPRYGVLTIGISGGALGAVVAANLYRDLLMAVAEHPHKVTQLHVSLDLPTYAPPLLDAVYAAGKAGRVRLSSRAVRPASVRRVQSQNEFGDDTGTVYLGSKKAEAYAYVYDKTHERLGRCQVRIPPTTRVECGATHKFGVSLRDAAEPAPLFYHLASPDIIAKPEHIPPWVKGAEGFELPRRQPPLPAERLRARIEHSADLDEILQLAERSGPQGYALMLRLIEQKACRLRGPGLVKTA